MLFIETFVVVIVKACERKRKEMKLKISSNFCKRNTKFKYNHLDSALNNRKLERVLQKIPP